MLTEKQRKVVKSTMTWLHNDVSFQCHKFRDMNAFQGVQTMPAQHGLSKTWYFGY